MMQNTQKAALLRRAIEQLEEADALVQTALGECDVCMDTCMRIQDLIFDLEADVAELEANNA